MRNILSSAPRVTRFKINWDDNASQADPHAPPEYNENVPPSPPPGVHYSEAMLEDMQEAMGGPAADPQTNGTLPNVNGMHASDASSNNAPNKPFPPCLENSIDAMEAQLLADWLQPLSGFCAPLWLCRMDEAEWRVPFHGHAALQGGWSSRTWNHCICGNNAVSYSVSEHWDNVIRYASLLVLSLLHEIKSCWMAFSDIA